MANTLMDHYKRSKLAANDTSLDNCLRVTHHMLKKAKYCFLVTQGDKGWCNTRLVQPIIDVDENNPNNFKIWVGTRLDLRKVEEIWNNPKVTLAFEDSREDANLVVYGNAFVESNVQIKQNYWRATWKLFFPDGPKSDDYIAIRIEPTRLEVLNFKRKITPKPFGLRAAKLIQNNGEWQTDKLSEQA